MKKLILLSIINFLCMLYQPAYAKDAGCNNDGTQAFNDAYNMLSSARTGVDTQISMNSSFLSNLERLQHKYCDPVSLQDKEVSLESIIKDAARALIRSIKGN